MSRPTSDAKGTNRFFGEPQEGALRVTALEQFVRCYERCVFAFLSRALGYGLSVDDLAQEVFMRAYQALSEFEPTGRARPSTWLFTIAYHVLVDARRRQKSDYVMLSEEHESIDPNNPERQLWHRQLNAALARAVAELSPDQRDTFILAEFHELSVTDIARVTGTLESTVKTRLFRARGHLRQLQRPIDSSRICKMKARLLVLLLLVSCSGHIPRQAGSLDVFNPHGFSQRLETKARLKAAPAPMPTSTAKNLTSTSSGAED